MHQTSDKLEPIPKYVAIADVLQSEIEQGNYRMGEKIPSEAQLCRRFNENRYTVRQALYLLVNTGIVRSHQGKGHFVCGRPLHIRYTVAASMRFSEMTKQLGCKPEAKVLSKERIDPPEPVAKALQLGEQEHVYRLEILRYADHIPLAFNVTWLPASRFPDLLQNLEPLHSLYAILENKYRVTPVRWKSSFRAAYPNALEARYLQIPPNQNVLHIVSVMRDERGRLVEYTSAKYRGDLCHVSIQF